MEIVKVTPYADRGLLRHRIEWQDGDARGVADSHCAITGQPLGPNHTLCVRHCRYYGHYHKDVNHTIAQYLRQEISEQDMLAVFRSMNQYPENEPMVE